MIIPFKALMSDAIESTKLLYTKRMEMIADGCWKG